LIQLNPRFNSIEITLLSVLGICLAILVTLALIVTFTEVGIQINRIGFNNMYNQIGLYTFAIGLISTVSFAAYRGYRYSKAQNNTQPTIQK
jgi:uncharacterized BrkB/YihY/UPF0761 family membrane protein